jgi:hypothetical protein
MTLHLPVPDELIEQVAERAAELVAARSQPEAERWMTHAEAARHLGISASQLYSLAAQRHRNHLPVLKEGQRSFYLPSALTRWRLENDNRNGGPA